MDQEIAQEGGKTLDGLARRMWQYKAVRYVVYFLLLAIAVLFFGREYAANILMFHPVKGGSLNFAQEVRFNGLHGYYVKCNDELKENPKTLLYFHGNAGNASFREHPLKMLRPHFNVLIFDYSGYGHSGGKPTEAQLYQDGQNAYDFLRKTTKPEDIILYGVSLGGGVASHVATKNECSGLILQSTFSGVDDFVPSLLKPFAPWFPNRSNLEKVNCPVLIMHGRQDEIIPYRSARLLHAHKPTAEFFDLQGGHNNTYYSEKMINTMVRFAYDGESSGSDA